MNAVKRKDCDMTQGVIWKQILMFALPLIAGNLFQQLYNTVDSIVVGNFVGKEALAAVGSVGPILNSMIGFFVGLSTGAGVVISQYYGAKEEEKVSRAVHSMLCLTLLLCVVITVLGVLLCPIMLNLMQTPEDVYREAKEYLMIYFSGISGLLLYNMGSGVLRAVGDSRHPLYFLIFSACTNTVLDIVFVAGFHAGIAGAAWATVIAQCLSAVMVLATLMRSDGAYRLVWRRLAVDWKILRRIVSVGLPAALQMVITSVSNIFVQSYINVFGSDVMAGWSAYSKIDAFMMLPMQSVSMAATTFVGQNLGAGEMKRAKKGTHASIFLSICITVAIMIPLLIFAPFMVSLFNGDVEVLRYGTLFVRMLSPFYVMCCINQIYAGSLRGAGDSRAPMVIMLCCFVFFRQVYLFVTSRVFGTIHWVAFGYPAGWILCSLIISIYYKMGRWKKRVIQINEE